MVAATAGQSRRSFQSNWMTNKGIAGSEPASPHAGVIKAQCSGRAAGLILGQHPELRSVAAMDQVNGAASPYEGIRLVDIATECCAQNGIETRYKSNAQIITNALGTGDFQRALSEVFVTGLVYGFFGIGRGILQVASERIGVADFQEQKRTRWSTSAPDFIAKEEAAEFEYGVLGAESESYRIRNYGRIFQLSLEAMYGAGDGLASAGVLAGRAAINHQRKVVADLVSSNPNLSDGNPAFHASHGNLTDTHANLDVGALDAGRQKMRGQRDVETDALIPVAPAFLVVPASLETAAQQVQMSIYAAATGDANPFAGTFEIVVEEHLPDGAAYLFAGPTVFPGVECAYLANSGIPETQSWLNPVEDVMNHRVALRWGAGWVDHRAAVKIPISG